jgi:hypothetical protein
MKSTHRTHFLFIEPKCPPTIEPIEDEITRKTDFIFSQLKQDGLYRGIHTTPFGVYSSNCDYVHETFPLISNSLATYYIRHHRADISLKQIAWIHELFEILQNSNYYSVKPQNIYYFKVYERDGMGYGNALTSAVKSVGSKEGIQNLLTKTFFRILTESQYLELIKQANDSFETEIEGCESVEVHDVIKHHFVAH